MNAKSPIARERARLPGGETSEYFVPSPQCVNFRFQSILIARRCRTVDAATVDIPAGVHNPLLLLCTMREPAPSVDRHVSITSVHQRTEWRQRHAHRCYPACGRTTAGWPSRRARARSASRQRWRKTGGCPASRAARRQCSLTGHWHDQGLAAAAAARVQAGVYPLGLRISGRATGLPLSSSTATHVV